MKERKQPGRNSKVRIECLKEEKLGRKEDHNTCPLQNREPG